MKMILASQSPYRRQQLQNFGVRFEAVKPLVDEDALKKIGPADLTELTRFLALKKAESLKSQYPERLILGSDQLGELDGRRLDKPGTRDKAFAQLRALSGKEHRLITSLALIYGAQTLILTDTTKVRFKILGDKMINAYLDIDEPYDCAGSYKIEKAGFALVESLDTQDPSAIQGLPLMSLARGLESLRLSLSQFWEKT